LGAGGTSVDGIVRLGGGVEHRDFEAASSSAPWFELTPAIRVRQRLGAFGLALTSGWLIRNGRAGLERGAARQWWGGPLLAAHLDWKM
jgi:hypothetical protein